MIRDQSAHLQLILHSYAAGRAWDQRIHALICKGMRLNLNCQKPVHVQGQFWWKMFWKIVIVTWVDFTLSISIRLYHCPQIFGFLLNMGPCGCDTWFVSWSGVCSHLPLWIWGCNPCADVAGDGFQSTSSTWHGTLVHTGKDYHEGGSKTKMLLSACIYVHGQYIELWFFNDPLTFTS